MDIVTLLFIFGSVLLVSVVALFALLPFLFSHKISKQVLMTLLSLSVGSLLGTVFFHFLPESVEQGGFTTLTSLAIIAGFFTFFLLERLVHHHHHHQEKKHAAHTKHDCAHHHATDSVHGAAHSHGFHLAFVNIVGDFFHNFIDGLVIATSYVVSVPVGIAATISILLHEVPQEIADVGVLLYSGFSKLKAFIFNGVSALGALLGALLGVILLNQASQLSLLLLPFAAGSFLYIAATNLLPELHRHCSWKETLVHVIAMIIGVGIMVGLTTLGLGHN